MAHETYNPWFGSSRKPAGPVDEPAAKQQFVIQREEDQKLLGNDNKPASTTENAQTFDSRALATIWAERASARHPGTWKVVPAPTEDPDGDERLAA